MKKIIFLIVALFIIIDCFSVNAYYEEDYYYPDARVYYTFDSDSISYDTDGNCTITDFSPYEFDITVPKENIAITNDCISGSFTIPTEVFSDTTEFTLNFWYEADPEKDGYASQAIIEFGDMMFTGVTGSGFVRLCTYFENKQTVYAPGLTNSINISKPNMYTLIKSEGKINMYLNGQTIKSRILGNRQSNINFSDSAASGAEFKVSGYMIDELSLYNKVLSEDEIGKLYERTSVKIEEAFSIPTESPEKLPYKITDFQITDINGVQIDEVTIDTGFFVDAKVKKTVGSHEKVQFIIAIYGKNGNLLDIKCINTDFSVNDTCLLRHKMDGQSTEIGSIIAYIWNNVHDMKPLSESCKVSYVTK